MSGDATSPAVPSVPSDDAGRPWFRDLPRAVWWITAAHFLLLLVLAGRYGHHRDELYFLEATQHLALGYVDQPPLVVYLAWLQTELFGVAVDTLRYLSAVASAGSVVVGALLAREFGGGRRAQIVAAGALAGSPFVLTTGHLLSTATFDFFFWMVGILVATRLLRTGETRLWVAFGALVGIALWNKHLVILLAVSLVLALTVSRRWRLLTPKWLVLGGIIAVGIAAPTLWWQATNGWPQLEMAGALSDRLGNENRTMLLPLQLLLIGPFLLPLVIAGLRWLFQRGRGGETYRPLLIAYLAALVLTFATGGRPYYPLPLAATVVVAGAVALERASLRWLAPAVAINALVALPLSLPLVPEGDLASTPIGDINDTQVEQVGWVRLKNQIQLVRYALPAAEADDVVVVTGTYGEAGAIDLYGDHAGLTPAYSGHNSYWHWRRPTDDDATVIAVRLPEELLSRNFEDCELAATVEIPFGIDNEVAGQPIWVCRGLRGTWEQAWPDFRHYN
ncbi:MAG: glycosyltransferase family 39 protein [Nitriliruptorales bacterium]|nr:glycosyltransferase family 39 protein [Nitriliruptorales bacterium]